jgi:hypothetical protein
MISVNLDVEPGEVAFVESKGRRYAILCAPEEGSEPRQLPASIITPVCSDLGSEHPYTAQSKRQLSDRERSEMQTRHLASSLQIKQISSGVWCVYDGSVLVGWSATRSGCDEVLANYLEARAEVMREGRRGSVRERLTYRSS